MLPLVTWTWPDTPAMIAVVLLGALLAQWLLVRAIRMGVDASVKRTQGRNAGQGGRAERILALATGAASQRHEARVRTAASILRSIVEIVVWVIAILTIVSILGFPMAPVLTSAGVGGAALAFGSQSLIKDYLSGVFMLLEDQYGVGDLIDLGDVSGTVEDVGLRITRLRDPGGQVWYIRNGEITKLGNQSQGYSTGTVDVPVAYDEDAARVMDVLEAAVEAVYADPRWEDVLLDKPEVAGVNAVAGGAMTIRIFAKCAPNQHWAVQRDILERCVQELQRAGVRGPALMTNHPPGQEA